MSRTLFVLTSPLQARHAGHYAAHARLGAGQAWVAFVKSVREPDNAQTRVALAAAGFQLVREFEPLLPVARPALSARRRPRDREAEALEREELGRRRAFVDDVGRFFDEAGAGFDRVVLGDYRPVSFRQFLTRLDLARVECVLLDDGSVSQEVMAFRERKQHVAEVVRAIPLAGVMVTEPDPLSYRDPARLTYFSIYRGRLADGDAIVANPRYDDVFRDVTPQLRAELWIAGCSHVESGVAHDAAYLDLVTRARSLTPDLSCVYLPHRREDMDKVRRVAGLVGAEILPTQGIEGLIVATGEAPAALVSFGSTVLDTVSRMVGAHVACALMVPPSSYFRGPRRAHVEAIMRANVRENPAVVGLFADDPFAARRWAAERILRAGKPSDAAPSNGIAQRAVVGRSDGFSRHDLPDGSVLLLERPDQLWRRVEVGFVETAPGAPGCLAFRIASEGRSYLRLRAVSAADRSVYVECDLYLDEANQAEQMQDGVRIQADVHVDQARRAVVRAIVSAEAGGRYVVEATPRADASARGSFLKGDPAIGLSFPPSIAGAGAMMRVDGGVVSAMLQVSLGGGSIGVVRLKIGDRTLDLALRPAVEERCEPAAIRRASADVVVIAYAEDTSEALMARAVPVLIERQGGDLVVRTPVDAVAAPLVDPQAVIQVAALDPQTGERRVIEVAVSPDVSDPARSYRVAC